MGISWKKARQYIYRVFKITDWEVSRLFQGKNTGGRERAQPALPELRPERETLAPRGMSTRRAAWST